ncbi:MAG: hypothetical protein ACXWG2_08140 [Solirubrobacterales bacterium]
MGQDKRRRVIGHAHGPPRSPASPCGEPGSPQPAPAGSPCARGETSGNEASGSG